MPPNSTLRTYINALNTGDTNVTRVLSILMHYPARWQPNVADITVDPLSTFLKDLFSAPGRMKFEEIDHIEEAWPMDQKEELRTHVLQAIQTGRRMIFKWAPTSEQAPRTDIVWPPSSTNLTVPVRVTFHSPAAGFVFSGEALSGEEGNDDDVVIAT